MDLRKIGELIKDLYETRQLKKEVLDNEVRIKQSLDAIIKDAKVVSASGYILIKNEKNRESISKKKIIEAYGTDGLSSVSEKITYYTLEVKKVS